MITARRFLFLCCLTLLSAVAAPATGLAGGALWQVSTIDALLAGHYDGTADLARLKTHGDFGLGTFDALNGEMAVLDGEVYQILADGTVARPPDGETTPFAAVAFFEPEITFDLTGQPDLERLEAALLRAMPPTDAPCAIRVDGHFASLTVRSVPAQTKPYRRLAEVVADEQSVFHLNDVDGTLVGFWCPEDLRGLNVPGFHLHFLTADRRAGGHVLAAAMASGHAALDVLDGVLAVVPGQALDVTPARAGELQGVER
jgi:acetolactate decarboxylase